MTFSPNCNQVHSNDLMYRSQQQHLNYIIVPALTASPLDFTITHFSLSKKGICYMYLYNAHRTLYVNTSKLKSTKTFFYTLHNSLKNQTEKYKHFVSDNSFCFDTNLNIVGNQNIHCGITMGLQLLASLIVTYNHIGFLQIKNTYTK